MNLASYQLLYPATVVPGSSTISPVGAANQAPCLQRFVASSKDDLQHQRVAEQPQGTIAVLFLRGFNPSTLLKACTHTTIFLKHR